MVRAWILRAIIAAAMVAAVSTARAAEPSIDPNSGLIVNTRMNSGVPLGGIGAGKIEFMTDGSFSSCTINNNWDSPINDLPGCFLAAYAKSGDTTWAKVLRLNDPYGLPTIGEIRYRGIFPRALVEYDDPGMPIRLSLEAFSPLIPHDLKHSTMPAAIFLVRVENPTDQPVEVAVMLSWEDLMGRLDNSPRPVRRGDSLTSRRADGVAGVIFAAMASMDEPTGRDARASGEYAVACRQSEGLRIDTRLDQVPKVRWLMDDLADDGILNRPPAPALYAEPMPNGALATKVELAPGEAHTFPFVFAWYTPHHVVKNGTDYGKGYQNYYDDAWAVAVEALTHADELLAAVKAWQEPVLNSSLPEWLKYKLFADLHTMYANTVYTRDGKFAVLESPIDMGGALGTMDQRLSAHAFYTTFFPELDASELRLFAAAQRKSGEITHFDGNVNESVGSGDVGYGVTGWPDLSCSFIMQCYKFYLWTGDRAFLDEMYPRCKQAIAYLKSTDTDGDFIPQGGSTWDYQHYPGSFVYTADVYLAALRCCEQMAITLGDGAFADECRDLIAAVRQSMIAELWTGRYFAKYYDPATGFRSSNIFLGQLAGEWMLHLIDEPELLPREMVESTVSSLIDLCAMTSPHLPPTEMRADGTPEPRLSGIGWVQYAETYCASLAIYHDRVADALEVVRRINDSVWLANRSPWQVALAYDPNTGRQQWGRWYMTNPASWFLLYALQGLAIDHHAGRLVIEPHVPAEWREWTLPIYAPRFWAQMRVRDSEQGGRDVRLEVTKTFGDQPPAFVELVIAAPAGIDPSQAAVRVAVNGSPVAGEQAASRGRPAWRFAAPLEISAGDVLSVSLAGGESSGFLIRAGEKRIVRQGSGCTADGLSIDDKGVISFDLTNPTADAQHVVLRARGLAAGKYRIVSPAVEQVANAAALARGVGLEVPAGAAPSTTVGLLRAVGQRLRPIANNPRERRALGKSAETVSALVEQVEAALAAHDATRRMSVVIAPADAEAAAPARESVEDAVQRVADAAAAVGAAREELSPADLPAGTRDRVLGALIPIDISVEIGEFKPGSTMPMTARVTNLTEGPVSVTLSPSVPECCRVSVGDDRTIEGLASGESATARWEVSIAADAAPQRYVFEVTGDVTGHGASYSCYGWVSVGHAFLRDWSVIGPFDNRGGEGVDRVYPPEKKIDLTARHQGAEAMVAWQAYQGGEDGVSLLEALGPRDYVVGYAVCYLRVPDTTDVILEIGSDDQCKVWLNGELIHRFDGERAARPAEDRVPATLRKGWNTLLLKIAQARGDWKFCLEVLGARGGAVPGLEVRATPP